MKSFGKQPTHPPTPQPKTYDKSDCQLTEFPIIKLHILQNIHTINLSHNLICDLTAIQVHINTSQHVLWQLKSVDLSFNRIPTVAALAPLATAAVNLKEIKLTDNPLTRTLNFLYELVLIFKQINEITHSNTLWVDHEFRAKVVEFHMKGGALIERFMNKIHSLTTNICEASMEYEYLETIKSIFASLQQHQNSILEHNQILFHTMRSFIEASSFPSSNKNHQKYESPVFLRANGQIDAVSEYKISDMSNNLTRYLSQQSEQLQVLHLKTPQNGFSHFYYGAVLENRAIQLKLLQEIEVDEEQNERLEKGECDKFDKKRLVGQLQAKWKKQTQLTYTQFPQITSNNIPPLANSPFKSIQTQTSTEREFMFSPKKRESQKMLFFGLEREWTLATHKFIMHRMLSFMKHLSASNAIKGKDKETRLETYHEIYRNKIEVQDDEQEQQARFQKYATFGQKNDMGANLSNFQVQGSPSDQDSLDFQNQASPKSQNKYIIATCLNIFQQIVKKIVFRRIKTTFTVKPMQLAYLVEAIEKIELKILQDSLRKIGKYALFVEYLTNKMQKYKLQRVFKAWKQLKRRKLKLIKSLINRKSKKETAFLSIIMAQWRITSSHMRLQQNRRERRQMLSAECPLSEMSGIVVRSATYHKLQATHTNRLTTHYNNHRKFKRRQY